MKKTYTIDVVTRLQDNGDGGYTMYVYNDNEELLDDHPLAEESLLSSDQREAILSEEDPYENGYIGTDTIEVEVDDNGVARLAVAMSFHAGQ